MARIRDTLATIACGYVTRSEGVWLLVALGFSLRKARRTVEGL